VVGSSIRTMIKTSANFKNQHEKGSLGTKRVTGTGPGNLKNLERFCVKE